jgi:surface protein
MSYLMAGATAFNQDLSGWNVGNVTDSSEFDTGATSWLPANKPSF